MKNGFIGLVSAVALATIATHGCGGSSGGGSGGNASGGAGAGGSSASGGSGGSSSQANCPAGQTCGGDLTGTWTVTSSCLTLSGSMDGSSLYLGCAKVPVTGSLKVTGTWTANANGTYSDNTLTTGSMTFPLSSSCLTVSSTPVQCSKISGDFTAAGWDTATCSTDASGQCNCSTTAKQKGGIGVIYPNASDSGAYTTSASGLNVDEQMDYSYCVSGDTLTLTPKSNVLPLTGTIVLQKASTTPGTGGASGGATGSGGTTSGTGGTAISAGGTAAGGATGTGTGPCDIYASANVKCIAAHSTVRALLGSYNGPLYQVKRADGTTKDIGVLSPGGFADSAAQDAFCTSTCVITRVYDQSGNGNLVAAQTPDTKDMTPPGHSGMTAASATKDPLTVGGHRVYSLYTNTSQAYWHDGSKSGVPTGAAPQGVYMVTSGTHHNNGCCYDYGNGETSRTYVPGASMDAVNFSSSPAIWGSGAGAGPWVMADLEGGVFSGATTGNNTNNPSQTAKYVTAIEKNNGTTAFALRGGDATSGKLGTYYSGALPAGKNPMQKQGAIVLGAGGDCCYSNNNGSQGTFYEGAIVAGYPSDATDDAIQANIISAGYGN